MIIVMEYTAPEKHEAEKPVSTGDAAEDVRRESLRRRNESGLSYTSYANTSSYVGTVNLFNDSSNYSTFKLATHGSRDQIRELRRELNKKDHHVCKPYSPEWERRVLQLCYEFMESTDAHQYMVKNHLTIEGMFSETLQKLRNKYATLLPGAITYGMKEYQ